MAKGSGDVLAEFPYYNELGDVSWMTVSISRGDALDLFKELAAELGYNLIKCVED